MKGITGLNSYPNQGRDLVLITMIVLLTIVGLVTVYSASSERSNEDFGNPHKMFIKQFVRTIIGFGLLFIAAWIPYSIWKKFAVPAMILCGFFLLLIFASNLGHESKGASRWLHLGPVRFQPSELAKFSIVLFIAAWSAQKGEEMKSFKKGILFPLGFSMILIFMVAIQPDFSTAVMLSVIAFMMIFVSGANIKHIAVIISPLIFIATFFIFTSKYRLARLLDFIGVGVNIEKAHPQVLQAWIGFGRGGFFGVGVGESRQKLLILPEAHTDFIYSVLGEEWGFVGAVTLMVLFMILIWRGIKIGMRCPDSFGAYLAIGITFSIGLYAIMNMGIAAGVLPTTGLPLPFISFGGTSLLLSYGAMGVLLNISRYSQTKPSFQSQGAI
ncbi:MAG: putative lipid II flippase FtsW [Candidatus Electryonea clarkiae]|nr:putative lipid II flippase FtsW [Candidatus Electryonea clarkiae]